MTAASPAPAGARPIAPPAAIEAAARRCATCNGRPAAFGADVSVERPGRWFCHAHSAFGGRRAA